MALLELDGNTYPIPIGELVLGSDAACGIVVSGSGVQPRHALFEGQPNGQVVIRKATPAAVVLINGVRLGAEPTPLLHGDKVDVDGHELNVVDERRSGSTQFVQAVKPPEGIAQTKGGSQGTGVTANTGGRLVSLTDGREYVISGASLVFGREAACDVVVDSKDVSRRHAEIVQTPKGYLIVDSSTNGTFVNEERVRGQRILTRADVVRIGDDNFRFYADVLPASPASAPPAHPAASAPPAPSAPAPRQPAAGSQRAQSGPLATFLVRSGALKGQRVEVRTPVVNIGRADYNDLPLADPSVSTSHAKVQRREGVWVLVDLDSTNGSFVDGERVQGELPIAPGALLKFGDIELLFEPTDDALGIGKGGGTVVMAGFASPPVPPPRGPAPARAPTLAEPPAPAPAIKLPPKPRPPAPAKAAAGVKPARPPAPSKKKGKGCGAGVIVLFAGAGGMAAVVYWILA
jgi:pSer/pThr/pTyr-binding forkhead associated (FHA) protein